MFSGGSTQVLLLAFWPQFSVEFDNVEFASVPEKNILLLPFESSNDPVGTGVTGAVVGTVVGAWVGS